MILHEVADLLASNLLLTRIRPGIWIPICEVRLRDQLIAENHHRLTTASRSHGQSLRSY